MTHHIQIHSGLDIYIYIYHCVKLLWFARVDAWCHETRLLQFPHYWWLVHVGWLPVTDIQENDLNLFFFQMWWPCGKANMAMQNPVDSCRITMNRWLSLYERSVPCNILHRWRCLARAQAANAWRNLRLSTSHLDPFGTVVSLGLPWSPNPPPNIQSRAPVKFAWCSVSQPN